MPHPRPPSPLNPPKPLLSPHHHHHHPTSSPPSHSPPRSEQRWALHRGERNTLQTLGKTFIFRQRFYFCPPDVFLLLLILLSLLIMKLPVGRCPAFSFSMIFKEKIHVHFIIVSMWDLFVSLLSFIQIHTYIFPPCVHYFYLILRQQVFFFLLFFSPFTAEKPEQCLV